MRTTIVPEVAKTYKSLKPLVEDFNALKAEGLAVGYSINRSRGCYILGLRLPNDEWVFLLE